MARRAEIGQHVFLHVVAAVKRGRHARGGVPSLFLVAERVRVHPQGVRQRRHRVAQLCGRVESEAVQAVVDDRRRIPQRPTRVPPRSLSAAHCESNVSSPYSSLCVASFATASGSARHDDASAAASHWSFIAHVSAVARTPCGRRADARDDRSRRTRARAPLIPREARARDASAAGRRRATTRRPRARRRLHHRQRSDGALRSGERPFVPLPGRGPVAGGGRGRR